MLELPVMLQTTSPPAISLPHPPLIVQGMAVPLRPSGTVRFRTVPKSFAGVVYIIVYRARADGACAVLKISVDMSYIVVYSR